jgi:hypothetical protein
MFSIRYERNNFCKLEATEHPIASILNNFILGEQTLKRLPLIRDQTGSAVIDLEVTTAFSFDCPTFAP